MKEIDRPHNGSPSANQPHDKFFREVFSQADYARDLLLATLPQRIAGLLDFRKIIVENTSMIERGEEKKSDLLIRTNLGDSPALVYVLVEHKSYADRWSVFQLLKYMVRIWERERTKKRADKTLPTIIPVLVYHGTGKWRLPLEFASYFVPAGELKPHIPAFQPVMVDLQAMEDHDFRGSKMIQAVLRTLKYSRENLPVHLVEILRGVLTVPMDEKHRVFVQRLLLYILEGCRDVDEQDVDRAILAIGSREVREAYMTVAEQLIARGKEEGKREGKLEGKEEGKREGKLEGMQESLLKQLAQKFGAVSEEDKKKISETRDPDKLNQALGLILESQSIEEILRPLN
jgi:predicted transposase/invertase (TIGR01784 family)